MSNNLKIKVSAETQQAEQGLVNVQTKVDKVSSSNDKLKTKQQTLIGQLRTTIRELQNMELQYSNLSQADKNSSFGQNLKKQIDELYQKAGSLQDIKADIQQNVNNIASDTAAWDATKQGIDVLSNSLQSMAGIYGALGGDVESFTKALNAMKTVESVTNTIIGIGNALQKQSALMIGVRSVQQKIANALTTTSTVATTAHTAALGAEATAAGTAATAIGAETVATEAATVAQTAFNIVANMNPYVLLATAVLAAGAAIVGFCSYMNDATEKEKKAQEEAKKLKKQQEELAHVNKTLGDKTGDLIGKFKVLQSEFKALKSEGEKKQWIEANQSAFDDLGVAVNNVNDAYDVFVQNAPKVIAALKAIAEAEAMKDLYKEAVKKKATEWDNRNKSRATGDYYVTPTQDNLTDAERKKYGLTGVNMTAMYQNQYNGGGHSTKQEATAEQLQQIAQDRMREAMQKNAAQAKAYQDNVDKYGKAFEDAFAKSLAAQAELATVGGKPKRKTGGSGGNNGSNSSGKSEDPKTGLDKLKAEKDELEKQLSALPIGVDSSKLQQQIKDKEAEIAAQEIVLGIRTEFEEGSLKYLEDQLSKKQTELQIEVDPDKRKEIYREIEKLTNQKKAIEFEYKSDRASLDKLKKELENISKPNNNHKVDYDGIKAAERDGNGKEQEIADNKQRIDNNIEAIRNYEKVLEELQAKQEELQATIDAGNDAGLDMSEATDQMNQYAEAIKTANEAIQQLEDENESASDIIIDNTKTLKKQEQTMKKLGKASDMIGDMGNAFSQLGSAFESPELEVAGIIANAIASVIQGYASASAQASSMGPWAWAAFSIAGLAQVAAVVAQIHNLSKHAGGGILDGATSVGDRTLFWGNAGEVILNKQQQGRLFHALDTGVGLNGNNIQTGGLVEFEITGNSLTGALRNTSAIEKHKLGGHRRV